ncbi:hypothetical protein JCM19992_00430 [Thermostilla marina]
MWSYIVRRLLLVIPTLFGITIISFVIMQLAPGDPLLSKLGSSGLAGQSNQTREAYLIMKRDLKLDRPLVLNFRYFRDYSDDVRLAAYYLSHTAEELEAELDALNAPAESLSDEQRTRLAFLRKLDIPDFDRKLAEPEKHGRLAAAVAGYTQVYCEDLGRHGVPAALRQLDDPNTDLRDRIGLVRALNLMVVEPFRFTYSSSGEPNDKETPEIVAAWTTWWENHRDEYPAIDARRREELEDQFRRLVDEKDRKVLFEEVEYVDPEAAGFFVEKLRDAKNVRERFTASLILRATVRSTIPLDVSDDRSIDDLDRVIENWHAHYETYRARYEPSWGRRLAAVFLDTQYAYMVARLATFRFGRSAVKSREPVSQKIWRAVLVSAPLMFLSQIIIYLLAVPLGIVAAVKRDTWVDRLITLKLFLLYSIPPFVAGMLFLLFFCYGSYVKWFPSMGLHSEGAENFGFFRYLLDYAWHAFLPVVCLSLFSLAGLAMYSRTSMLDVIGQDYIRTARAKGLSETTVILKHALRNGLIPILTLFSNFLPALLGGSVLIEYLFGIHGMGRLSWESIELKDYPTLMALIYVDAIVVLLSILMTDLLYVLVDPRISFSGQGKAE